MKQGAQAMPLQPFASLPFTATNALARLLGGAAGWIDSTPTPPPPAKSPHVDDIAELRREIDALKRRARRTARG